MMRIRFPNAISSLFAGIKIGISFSLIGVIVGEFVGGEKGPGSVIVTSQVPFPSAHAFAVILLLGVIGAAMFYIAEVENWASPWHISQRSYRI